MKTKLLKVCALPYKKTYTPGINIKGEYLIKHGFNIGDFVHVEISENRIIISKDTKTNIVSLFSHQNDKFDQLVESFDLNIIP